MCRHIFEVYVYFISIVYITDDGVGPEILLIKNEFNFFNWGLGGASFGLTHIYIYIYSIKIGQ